MCSEITVNSPGNACSEILQKKKEGLSQREGSHGPRERGVEEDENGRREQRDGVRLVEERQRYVVDSVLVDRAEMVAAGRTAAAPRPPTAELVVVVRRAAARAGADAALQTARHSRRRPPPAPLSPDDKLPTKFRPTSAHLPYRTFPSRKC